MALQGQEGGQGGGMGVRRDGETGYGSNKQAGRQAGTYIRTDRQAGSFASLVSRYT
jgi:hypothetical protein